MVSQDIPVLGHDVDPNVEEAQAGENEHVVFSVFIDVFQKVTWHVCPVDSGVDVVGHVVPIIKSVLVVKMVDRLIS